MAEHNHRYGRMPLVQLADHDAAGIHSRGVDRAIYGDPEPASLLSRVPQIFLVARWPLTHRKIHLREAMLGGSLRPVQSQAMGRVRLCSPCPPSSPPPGAQFQAPCPFAYVPQERPESCESAHPLERASGFLVRSPVNRQPSKLTYALPSMHIPHAALWHGLRIHWRQALLPLPLPNPLGLQKNPRLLECLQTDRSRWLAQSSQPPPSQS